MIRSLTKIVVFFCYILLFTSCKNQLTSCCKENNEFSYTEYTGINENKFEMDSNIDISHVRKRYRENPNNRTLGFFNLKRSEKNYLSYINLSKDSLLFINLIDSSDFNKTSIASFLDKQDSYNCRIINDTLHLINSRTFVYTQLKIHNDFSLTKEFSLDLKKIINFKGLYLFGNYLIDKNLEFCHPFLILTYGDFKKKNNAGKTVYFVINTETGEVKKRLDFPNKYRDCELRTPYSISEKIDNDHILTVLPKSDELFYWNIRSGQMKHEQHSFNFDSKFMCFDKDMNRNLAAALKYDLNDEDNSNLIYNGNYIYIIKRLRKEKKSDPNKVAILVFDDSLNHIGSIFPKYDLWTRMSFPYKKGILLFSSTTNKGYYYAFK